MASLQIYGHGKSNDLELSLGADVMPSALEAGAMSLPVTRHYITRDSSPSSHQNRMSP
jgi:hypothetical protein